MEKHDQILFTANHYLLCSDIRYDNANIPMWTMLKKKCKLKVAKLLRLSIHKVKTAPTLTFITLKQSELQQKYHIETVSNLLLRANA